MTSATPPTAEHIDRFVNVPVVTQRQASTILSVLQQRQVLVIQKVQKTVEVPQVQCNVRVVDVPAIKEQQVLTIQLTVQKSISEIDECGTQATEIRQLQHAEFVRLKIADVLSSCRADSMHPSRTRTHRRLN